MRSEGPAVAQRIKAVIDLHRSVSEPVISIHAGHRFEVDPGVFSPFIAPSGSVGLAFSAIPGLRGKRVLDIGCGSGVIACMMALSGAERVVGVDINPAAVANAKRNASNLGLDELTSFREGRLFDPISQFEQFDVIMADLPFTPGEPADMLEAAFYDPGLTSIRELVASLPNHLQDQQAKGFICLSGFGGEEIPKQIKAEGMRHHSFLRLDLEWMSFDLLRVSLK